MDPHDYERLRTLLEPSAPHEPKLGKWYMWRLPDGSLMPAELRERGLGFIYLWSFFSCGVCGFFRHDAVTPEAELPAPTATETECDWLPRALREGKRLP